MTPKDGFSAEEREAMKQRAAELRASKGLKGSAKREREAQACADAIAAMEDNDKQVAQLLDDLVTELAPDLDPKTLYGFPAYARDGKVVVFYQPATRWKSRYGTVAFDETARKLVGLFQKNFTKYEQTVDAEVRAAAPEVRLAAE